MLVESKVVFGIFNVIVDFFVADCNDEWHEVLVVRNCQGVLVHLVIGEVGVDEIVNSVSDGVECIFAVLTVVIVVVFLVGNFGIRTPAPAGVTLAVACTLIGFDIPGFL